MEMVATNLQSIIVEITNSKDDTSSQVVSPKCLLVVHEILFCQRCFNYCDFFVFANNRK